MLLATPLTASRPVQLPQRAARSGRSLRAPKATHQPVVAFLSESKETPKSVEAQPTVSVRFTLQRKVPFGQELALVGDVPQLGSWDLGQAVHMNWSEGDTWTADVELPAGATLEWKFVQQIPGCPAVWESCQNRTLSVDAAAADLTCAWAAPLATALKPSLATQQLAKLISGSAGEGDETTDDDAPARPFKPSATLAQIADVVKQSLRGNAESQAAKQEAKPAPAGKAQDGAPAAPTPTTASSALLSAPLVDPLAAPEVPTTSGGTGPAAKGPTGGASSAPSAKTAPTLSAEAEAAVSSIIDGAGPTRTGVTATGGASRTSSGPNPSKGPSGTGGGDAEREAVKTGAATAVATPVAATQPASSLQSIGKMAGTVVMGVGAAAMLSAFAIDIADVAVLGAVAAGSMAALTTPGSTSTSTSKKAGKRRGGKAGAVAGEAAEVEVVEVAGEPAAEAQPKMIAQKASAPGVILAAGVLSAIDAGRKILASSDEEDTGASGKARK